MCSINRSFNTTYNDDEEVPPYTGIMFEVTARSEPVIVNAFELDLRLENATDLAIEIYTILGSYGDVVDKPEKWTLIANTEVVLSASGGGIVPVQKFVPVRIDAAQRQSFYITMTGPYLDHNVNALQKTGELQSTGEDLQVYVGSGLTEYKFPGQMDKVLHPMFTGVIHYARPYDCDTVVMSTTVFEFSVLFRKSVGNKADVTKAISDALDELLSHDPHLSSYVSDFALVKQDGETEPLQYTQNCPIIWDECPTSYLYTTFNFMHEDALNHGRLLYEIYQSTEKIMAFVQSKTQGIDSVYIGAESVAARFGITLVGVPSDEEMNEMQLKYFADTTKRFLGEALRSRGIMFDVEADGQTQIAGQHLRRSLADPASGTTVGDKFKVEGTILGGLPGSTRKEEFRFALNDAFDSGSEVYVSMLTEGVYLPDALNDHDGYAFFEKIVGISAQFSILEEPGEIQGESSKSRIGPIIGEVIAGIALLGAVFYLYRHQKKHNFHKREAEQYRKQMKDERQKRRLMKANSRMSDDWGDKGNDESPEERTLTPICSMDSFLESQAGPPSPSPSFGDQGFPIASITDEKPATPSESIKRSPQGNNLSKSSPDAIAAMTTQHQASPATPRRMGSAHSVGSRTPQRPMKVSLSVEGTRESGTPRRRIDNLSCPQRSEASIPTLSCTPTAKRKVTASKSSPDVIAAMTTQHQASPKTPRRMGSAHSVGSRTPQRPMKVSLSAGSARDPQTPRQGIGNSAGPQSNKAPMQSLSCSPAPKRKVAASKSGPGAIAAMKKDQQASEAQPRQMGHAHSFGSMTPQRPIKVSLSTGSARESQTPWQGIDNSAGPQRNKAPMQSLSCSPAPKRKVAASKSSPGAIAAMKIQHQASPAPPSRMRRVHSAGSTGVAQSPARKVPAARSLSVTKEGSNAYSQADRPTAGRASSARPHPSPNLHNSRRPARSKSGAPRNSLGDIAPPLK